MEHDEREFILMYNVRDGEIIRSSEREELNLQGSVLL